MKIRTHWLKEGQECPPFYLFSPPPLGSSLREFLSESLPPYCKKWGIRSGCDLGVYIGLGDGSRRLYEYLSKHLGKADSSAWVFPYLQPDMDGHNHVLFAIMERAKRPFLIGRDPLKKESDIKMSGETEHG